MQITLRKDVNAGASRLKNFKLMRSGIDVGPMLEEVRRHAALWTQDTSRQDSVAIHRETNAIILRSRTAPASADKRVRESYPYNILYVGRRSAVAPEFPQTCRLIESFASSAGGLLGRVAIVNLKPNGVVKLHIDGGLYYKLRSRYHLVLQSSNGSRMTSNGEQLTMQEGELWWINNRLPHEAFNDSDQDRIHVIFDLISPWSILAAAGRLVRYRGQQMRLIFRRSLSVVPRS